MSFFIICGRQTSTHICLFARHIICPVVVLIVLIDTNAITVSFDRVKNKNQENVRFLQLIFSIKVSKFFFSLKNQNEHCVSVFRNDKIMQMKWKMRGVFHYHFVCMNIKKIFFLDKANTSPSFYFFFVFFFFINPNFSPSPSLCYSPLRLRPVPRVCSVCVVDDNHSSSKHMEDHMWVRKREKKKQKERQNSWLPSLKRYRKGPSIMGNCRTYIYMPAYPVRSTCSIKSAHQKEAVDSIFFSAGLLIRETKNITHYWKTFSIVDFLMTIS